MYLSAQQERADMAKIDSIEDVQALLAEQGYICSRALGVLVFLALRLGRPLFLEGEAGTGKTEIATVVKTFGVLMTIGWMRPARCMNGISPRRWLRSAPPRRQGARTVRRCKRNCSAASI